MRTAIWASLSLALASSVIGACNWTEFDDLSNQAWAVSSGKPGSVKSADYATAIARGSVTGASGGKLVVIGNGEPTYSEILYAANGDASTPSTVVDLKTTYGIQTIADQPLVIADPTSDDISLIVGTDNGFAVLTGNTGTLKLYQLFNQPAAQPDAATFLEYTPQTKPMPLVGVGSLVEGVVLPALPTGAAQPACTLIDSSTPGFTAQIRALARMANAPTDDFLMWDATGRLYRYSGEAFNGCATPGLEPISSTATTFTPESGSQILRLDATRYLLAGHNGASGFLQVVDAGSAALVGGPVSLPGLASADVLVDSSGNGYAIAGVPTAQAGDVAAGEVQLYTVSVVTGISATPVATYHDAQPDAGQQFGRSVAVLPYNDTQVIAVAAKNEVFTYFRTNLGDGNPLYPETRQGH
jgi:hypothetical protein